MATQVAPFPPAGYIPADSAVPGIEVYTPAPVEQDDTREVVEFKCPQCGAATAYSATDGGLTCTFCGYYEPPQKAVVGKQATQFEFTVETMERAAQGWGQARKELQCQDCGAYTSVPPDTLAFTCPFCGSNKVIQRQAPQDVLRPRFLIPFKIEADPCQQIARQWLGSSWMTPGSLRQLAQVARFTGIYLPFWTFDATTKADWRAEVGHTRTETYYVNGKPRTRTVTVWKWESGHVSLFHDDLLVSGTSRVSNLLLGRIKAFDLRQLAPYEPKYLAGLHAQAYNIPLEQAWDTSRQEMREKTRLACRRQASTSKIRNFSMSLDFSDESWRYILLPSYLATYNYNAKTYQVMVNGQTGTISGQRPVSWLKVWLAVVGLLLPGLIIGLIGLVMMLSNPNASPAAEVIGFVLLIIGALFAFNLLRTAQAMDDV